MTWKNCANIVISRSSNTSVHTAMKYGLFDSEVINGAMLLLTDLWFVGSSHIDEEQDSIVNGKCCMLNDWWCIYSK